MTETQDLLAALFKDHPTTWTRGDGGLVLIKDANGRPIPLSRLVPEFCALANQHAKVERLRETASKYDADVQQLAGALVRTLQAALDEPASNTVGEHKAREALAAATNMLGTITHIGKDLQAAIAALKGEA